MAMQYPMRRQPSKPKRLRNRRPMSVRRTAYSSVEAIPIVEGSAELPWMRLVYTDRV